MVVDLGKSENNSWELSLFLYQSVFWGIKLGSTAQAQVIKLGVNCLYLLCHLLTPRLFFETGSQYMGQTGLQHADPASQALNCWLQVCAAMLVMNEYLK